MSRSRIRRRLPWLIGVAAVAAVVAVLVFALPNTGGRKNVEPPANGPKATIVTQEKRLRKLPPEARVVAGAFILTALARKHLERAWPLAGPQLKDGVTHEQWMKGNIAVPTFPGGIGLARMAVEEVTAKEVLLEVAIDPASKAKKYRPGVFWVQLNRVGKHWLVNQLQQRYDIAIPGLNT